MKQFLKIMGICSAILFLIAGFQLISITSVSGDSIAESFYHGVGWMSFGLALLSGGLLIGLAEKFEGNSLIELTAPIENSPINGDQGANLSIENDKVESAFTKLKKYWQEDYNEKS